MAPPAKKKAKKAPVEEEEEGLEEKENPEEEEEELIFTACHVLGGDLDQELPQDVDGDASLEVRRGKFVLDLFADDTSAAKTSTWSLETTRLALQKLTTSSTTADVLLQLQALTLGSGKVWQLFKNPIQSAAHIETANCLIDQALCRTTESKDTSVHKKASEHILMALTLWPCNPAALLCLANFHRMAMVPLGKGFDTHKERLEYSLQLYLAAAKCAHTTRKIALDCLASDNLETDDKYLVESILLEAAKVEELDDDECGPSQFLVTASCMAAFLASALGQHSVAKQVMLRFSSPDSPVTRIHPAVWDAFHALNTKQKQPNQFPPREPTRAVFTPRIFPNTVPDDLFQTLRHAFRPDAPYWEQSGYDRNVYYSFWTDWPLPKKDNNNNAYIVSNAVEHYIVQHLLPRIKTISPDHNLDQLKGFEWWVHTRPHGANMGHQLHFDTDEALLDQDEQVEFPISASVTYLNDDDNNDNQDNQVQNRQYGATILFDQTPASDQNAETVWMNIPQAKSFLIFPGDLLHGVLPCMAQNEDKSTPTTTTTTTTTHRLTFMVNFWSYRIPDRIQNQKLYGPSGPFPPKTREHSWTQDIETSYPRVIELPSDTIAPAKSTEDGLVAVSPAWEYLAMTNENANDEEDGAIAKEWRIPSNELEAPLIIPGSGSGINQRFFVTNAPDFFRSTLYEK